MCLSREGALTAASRAVIRKLENLHFTGALCSLMEKK